MFKYLQTSIKLFCCPRFLRVVWQCMGNVGTWSMSGKINMIYTEWTVVTDTYYAWQMGKYPSSESSSDLKFIQKLDNMIFSNVWNFHTIYSLWWALMPVLEFPNQMIYLGSVGGSIYYPITNLKELIWENVLKFLWEIH